MSAGLNDRLKCEHCGEPFVAYHFCSQQTDEGRFAAWWKEWQLLEWRRTSALRVPGQTMSPYYCNGERKPMYEAWMAARRLLRAELAASAEKMDCAHRCGVGGELATAIREGG